MIRLESCQNSLRKITQKVLWCAIVDPNSISNHKRPNIKMNTFRPSDHEMDEVHVSKVADILDGCSAIPF